MTRKPSPLRLSKGLERAAHEAERYASRLRALGLDNSARGVSAAARELCAASERAAKLAAAPKTDVR